MDCTKIKTVVAPSMKNSPLADTIQNTVATRRTLILARAHSKNFVRIELLETVKSVFGRCAARGRMLVWRRARRHLRHNDGWHHFTASINTNHIAHLFQCGLVRLGTRSRAADAVPYAGDHHHGNDSSNTRYRIGG